MFYFEDICGKKVLKSSLLDGLNHFFTTRESIIKTKQPEFELLVENNKKDFCKYFNINEKDFISPNQTHTSNVEIAQINKTDYPETDGIILANPKQAVFLNFADCTPLIFYDSEKKIAAVSHAGWRGTAGRIAVKTVEKMQKNFDCQNIKCAIGPAISKCCYNVGEDVFNQLMATVQNFEGLFEMRDDNIFVDLKAINKRQLEEIGIKEIDVCSYCTVCNNDLFFSYRKENATTNRHSAVVKLD